MKKSVMTTLLLIFLVSACQTAEIDATATATSTSTPLSTETPLPTITLTATNTPEPPATPTPEEVEPPQLYSECGDLSKVNILQYSNAGRAVIGPDGNFLPTGIIGVEHNIFGGMRTATGRACLTEVEGFTDPNFPSDAIRAKVVFYDTVGNPHEYTIMLGGILDNGDQKKISLCNSGGCSFYSMSDALEALNSFAADDEMTIQINIDFMISNNGPGTSLSTVIVLVNQHSDLLLQLRQAIETGTDFPEVPADFFLWINQVRYNLG